MSLGEIYAADPDGVDVSLEDSFAELPSTFDAENPMHKAAGAPPAPDAAPRPSVGIELKEIARPRSWGERCLIKCLPVLNSMPRSPAPKHD